MNAKHQFKYTYNETDLEDYSPLEVTFEMPGEINLTQMLNNFEQYLKACGFFFDGKLDFVEETYPEYLDEIEEESTYGCMADFDKGCDCLGDSMSTKEYQDQRLKEWNEGIARLDNEQKQKCREEALKMSDLHYEATKEVVKNNWVHGMCNPPSPDWKAQNKNK
jgi:hypothetical protein